MEEDTYSCPECGGKMRRLKTGAYICTELEAELHIENKHRVPKPGAFHKRLRYWSWSALAQAHWDE